MNEKKSTRIKHISINRKNNKEPDTGTKILFYIAVSDMADNVKKLWATLIPHMNKTQLARFLNILETQFLDAATKGIDENLRIKLEEINKKYAKSAV